MRVPGRPASGRRQRRCVGMRGLVGRAQIFVPAVGPFAADGPASASRIEQVARRGSSIGESRIWPVRWWLCWSRAISARPAARLPPASSPATKHAGLAAAPGAAPVQPLQGRVGCLERAREPVRGCVWIVERATMAPASASSVATAPPALQRAADECAAMQMQHQRGRAAGRACAYTARPDRAGPHLDDRSVHVAGMRATSSAAAGHRQCWR